MDGRPSDSVQLYLTQMSNTPLLSRQEEFEAARRIEEARKNLRHAMLATDYVLQVAVTMLDKVGRGQMRLEVACERPLMAEEQKRRALTCFILVATRRCRFRSRRGSGRPTTAGRQVCADRAAFRLLGTE